MILRSITKHVRDQNWFAVGVDFIIVVVGVFIGLQVDDWNQRRVERESDQRALALFVDELEQMMIEADEDLKTVASTLEELALGTGIALKCDASDSERVRLIAAIGSTLNWRVPDVRPSGLAEIGNSGTLARLGNTDLTRAVGTVNQLIKAMADSMILIAPQYGRAWERLLPHLALTAPVKLEKLDLGVTRQPSSDYLSLAPQESLCTDQSFLLGLSLMTDFYESALYNFDAWHQALSAAHRLAASEMK